MILSDRGRVGYCFIWVNVLNGLWGPQRYLEFGIYFVHLVYKEL